MVHCLVYAGLDTGSSDMYELRDVHSSSSDQGVCMCLCICLCCICAGTCVCVIFVSSTDKCMCLLRNYMAIVCDFLMKHHIMQSCGPGN